MNVPQIHNLHSQSFNSEFLEFVWKFPLTKSNQTQIIFKIYKNKSVLLVDGIIDDTGEYVESSMTSATLTTKHGEFSMGELESLKKDTIEYLN